MRLIAHDALIEARRIYDRVGVIAEEIRAGRASVAKVMFAELDAAVLSARPVLDGVIASQEQAAEALNLTQPAGRRVHPAEQLHAANDHLNGPFSYPDTIA